MPESTPVEPVEEERYGAVDDSDDDSDDSDELVGWSFSDAQGVQVTSASMVVVSVRVSVDTDRETAGVQRADTVTVLVTVGKP